MNKYITKISLNPENKYRIDKIKNLVMKVKNSEGIEVIPIAGGNIGYTVYDPVDMTYTILSADTARPIITTNTNGTFTIANNLNWQEDSIYEEIHN